MTAIESGFPAGRGRLYDGTVISIRGGISLVHSEGFTVPCEVRRRFRTGRRQLAVGDHVRFSRVENVTDGVDGVVEEVLPRRTQLARKSAGRERREQILVANVDQVLITICLGLPKANLGFVDRVLVGASVGRLDAVICLNKIDLRSSEDERFVESLPQVYQPLGVRVVLASAETGIGMEELKAVLASKVTVFSGPSGSGKSSLLNCLEPGLKLRTGEISEKWGKGKHATTWTSLLHLPFDAFVVDTPGVREFGLFQLKPSELGQHFPEFEEPSSACRFSDCRHVREPECGVQEAMAQGKIAASRYESYRNILADLEQETRPS